MQPDLQFELEFAKAYPSFTSNLSRLSPDLTPREIKISMYLRLNYNSKQIQNQLQPFTNKCKPLITVDLNLSRITNIVYVFP